MTSASGTIFRNVSILLLFVVIGASASTQWGNSTDEDVFQHILSPHPSRIQQLYSLTGPISRDRVEFTVDRQASGECMQAVRELFAGNYTNGIFMMLYSGKEPGDYGNYLECQELLNAHFCTVRYSIFNRTSVLVSSGLCIPSVCSEEELLWALKHIPNPSWLPVFDATTVECVPKTRPHLPKGGIVTVLVISILAGIVVVATMVDLGRRLVLRPEQPLADPQVSHFDISHDPVSPPDSPPHRSKSIPVLASSINSDPSEFAADTEHQLASSTDGRIQRVPQRRHSYYSPHEASEDDDDTAPSSYLNNEDDQDDDEVASEGKKLKKSNAGVSIPSLNYNAASTSKRSNDHENASSGMDASKNADSTGNHSDDSGHGNSRSSAQNPHNTSKNGSNEAEVRLPPPKSTWLKLLFCFSAAENFARLVKHFPSNKTNLNPLNSLRVVAMLWVLLGHTLLFTIFIGYTNPVQALHRLIPTVAFQVILNATLSVDVFFYLAGFLMAYFTLKELRQRQGRMNWLIVFVHRLWRMSPTMILALFFCWTVAPALGNGPWWRTFMRLTTSACKKYWWTNVLYINNFWNFDLDQTCLAWSWYMSTDMQFFVVAIPLVYVIYRWPRIGFTILGLLSIGSLAYVLGISITKHLSPMAIVMDDGWRIYIYTKPWARFSTFAIGIVGAYLLLAHEEKASSPHGFRRLPSIPQAILVAAAWIISVVLVLSNIFGTYSAYQPGAKPWSTARNTAYLTLSRPAFTLGLAIQAHLVMTSRASISLKDLLSHPVWTPFARLTFGAYLYHPIIMFGYYFSSYRPIEITGTLIFQNWLAFGVLAFIVSLLSFLLIERPTENLEAMLIDYLKSRAKAAKVKRMRNDDLQESDRPLLADHHEDV